MGRKRSGEYDWVCKRCLIACDYQRHYYNGHTVVRNPNDHLPQPMLRSDWDKETADIVQLARERAPKL